MNAYSGMYKPAADGGSLLVYGLPPVVPMPGTKPESRPEITI